MTLPKLKSNSSKPYKCSIIMLMNVVVNGLMTNYQKVGNGKLIVMLHGWGDSQETFSRLTELLKDHYTVLAVDLPGFGGTQRPPEAWSLSDYSRFVAKLLEKINVKEVEALLGHSFGGAITVNGTGKKIINAKKIILLASAGVRGKKPFRLKILKAGAKVGKIPLYLFPPNKAKKIKIFLYKKAGSDVLLFPNMRQTFAKTVKEDVRELAKNIGQPSLLIYGANDRVTTAHDGKLLAAVLRHSKLEILPGAGHFLHQEKPEQVASLIKEFVG